MAKAAALVGGVLIVIGVALGFAGSKDCGSVFRGPDEHQRSVDEVSAMFNGERYERPDCSSATDLTVPVWLLIGAGVVLGVGGLIGMSPQKTADSQEEIPSGND